MTDPAARERHAREELVDDLIARERAARVYMEEIPMWAAERRECLRELRRLLGTWKKVADATGQTLPAITKAAYKKAKEDAREP
jgi:hypothetical protein